jgi:hypothetical protein
MKGSGSAFVSATKQLMAAFSSSRDRKTPRLRRRRVSLAKKVSTALSDALTYLGMFVGGVVSTMAWIAIRLGTRASMVLS